MRFGGYLGATAIIATVLVARNPSALLAIVVLVPAIVGAVVALTRAFQRPRPRTNGNTA